MFSVWSNSYAPKESSQPQESHTYNANGRIPLSSLDINVLNNNEFNGDAGDEEILKLNVSGKRKRNAILSQEESELISIISNSISSQSSKYSSSTNSVISSKISTPKSCHNDKKLHVLTPMVLLEKLSPESLKKWPISNMQQVSQQLERYLKFGLDKGKVLPMPPSLEDSIEVKKKTKDQKPKNVKKLKKSLNNNIQINPADRAHVARVWQTIYQTGSPHTTHDNTLVCNALQMQIVQQGVQTCTELEASRKKSFRFCCRLVVRLGSSHSDLGGRSECGWHLLGKMRPLSVVAMHDHRPPFNNGSKATLQNGGH